MISPQTNSATLAVLGKRRSPRLRRLRERIILGGLLACGLFSLLTTVTIIMVLSKEAYGFFSLDEVSLWEFVTGTQWNPLLGARKHFGSPRLADSRQPKPKLLRRFLALGCDCRGDGVDQLARIPWLDQDGGNVWGLG